MSFTPQAVIFDLDGLLVNTEDLYDTVGDELLQARGKEFTPELKRAMIGLPGPVAFQVMIDAHQLDCSIDQLTAETKIIFDRILPSQLAPMPGAAELLAKLHAAKMPLAIATSSDRPMAERVLRQVGFFDYFRFLMTAADVAQGKPHPDIYLAASAKLQFEPAEILVFEDSQTGCKAAVSAGTNVVATPNRHTQGQDFSGSIMIANTLADPRVYELLNL